MDKRYDYDYENEYDYTWDDRYYGTGPTQPPKEKHGLMALMLILVIFLFGIITVLGILNIRLFQELKLKKQETELSISFATEATLPPETLPQEISPQEPVEAIAEENAELKLGTINVDDSPELAAKFKIMSIPTLVVMKNGVETAKSVGLRSKSEILKMLG